jgi:hypothetical protein
MVPAPRGAILPLQVLGRHNRKPTGVTMKKAHRKGQQRAKRRKAELRRAKTAARKKA